MQQKDKGKDVKYVAKFKILKNLKIDSVKSKVLNVIYLITILNFFEIKNKHC